ncbi:hypothetical protein [Sessilibacter sp. MAH2]
MKTHYLEADYRSETLEEIFVSLDHGFARYQKKYDENEWYDAYWAQEQTESIFGIAYVTAQTYITGAISDVSKISGYNAKSKKIEWLSTACKELQNGISTILFINTMANYYKHYEEWGQWKATGINKNTIETLLAFDINEETDFPCWEAAKILSGEKFPSNVSFLGEILIDWRKGLVQHVKIT